MGTANHLGLPRYELWPYPAYSDYPVKKQTIVTQAQMEKLMSDLMPKSDAFYVVLCKDNGEGSSSGKTYSTESAAQQHADELAIQYSKPYYVAKTVTKTEPVFKAKVSRL